MTGNPKASKWYSTPRALRKRKEICLSLSLDALARLEALAEARGELRSAIVEELILSAAD